MKIRQQHLYLLVLGLISVIVLTALGGGLFSQQGAWQLQWQHQVFSDLCHQSAERSFWMNGQPMAVCSRCFGIYTGFFIGWLLLPILMKLNYAIAAGSIKKIIVLVILINLFDITGNMFGFWENTLLSRMVLGSLIGSSAAILFTGDFFNRTIKSMGNHYGRFSTKRTN